MALTNNDLKQLMLTVAKANKNAPTAFSFGDKTYGYSELNEALRTELNLKAGNFNSYRRNQLDIFEIMQEVIDAVLPVKVLEQYGMFAEVKTFGQGDKPSFVVKRGRQRAKQFVTRVGLAGIYEVFKLDKDFVTVQTEAYGGAAQIGLEEFLDGIVDFSEMLQIIMDGLDEAVYREIAKALVAVRTQLPEANKATHAGFDSAKFDNLLAVSRAYGEPTIYATLELASKIVPADKWISDADKAEMRSQGYVGIYKGSRVIVLPQSFEDESNSVKVIDPSFAYILSGGDNKPVKIAFEGQSVVDEAKNRDQSREVQVYKKFGVSTIANNNICIFEDTSL